MKDANDASASVPPAEFKRRTDALRGEAHKLSPPGVFSIRELREKWGKMRPPVVHGLLRRGEVGIISAPPKAGKSWLIYDLAFSVATGGHFLREQWKCEQGKVLIFDNELHPETLSVRLPDLRANKMLSIDVDEVIKVVPLRGNLTDIKAVQSTLNLVKSWEPTLIIFDALYRMYWDGFNENDNAHQTQLCNILDQYSNQMNAAILSVHHQPKGNHSEKDVLDLGAGGGASARAVDVVIGMRPHEKPHHYVIETKFRTWAELDACVIQWEYPRWKPVDDVNPTELKGLKKLRARVKVVLDDLSDEKFCVYLKRSEWTNGTEVDARLRAATPDLSNRESQRLRSAIIAKYELHKVRPMTGVWSKDGVPFVCQYARGGGLQFKIA